MGGGGVGDECWEGAVDFLGGLGLDDEEGPVAAPRKVPWVQPGERSDDGGDCLLAPDAMGGEGDLPRGASSGGEGTASGGGAAGGDERSMQERVQELIDPDFWQRLCPELHVCDPASGPKARRGVFPLMAEDRTELVDELRGQMHRDGYFTLAAEGGGPAGMPWAVDLAAMGRAVATLVAAGWPASFMLMYDEPWVMAHQLTELLILTTGNQQVMDWFFFYVDPAKPGALKAGWAPHRDRGTDDTCRRFRADGTPEYATVWVALTDASPTNSCLMAVPKAFDRGYHEGDKGKSPLREIFGSPESFQAIRALPAAAGTVISFTHRLLHWGSAADPHARAEPRVAMSFAVADNSFEEPYISRSHLPLPPCELRAALVAAQAIAYCQNEDPGRERASLYWHAFLAFSHEFQANFARRVYGHKEWLDAKHGREAAGAKT